MFTWQGFIAANLGWVILFYVGWRNQRAAKASPLVETTHFLPRIRAIIEVALHPERAVMWHKPENGKWVRVFPNLDKDSSEVAGTRPDDGKVT